MPCYEDLQIMHNLAAVCFLSGRDVIVPEYMKCKYFPISYRIIYMGSATVLRVGLYLLLHSDFKDIRHMKNKKMGIGSKNC